MSTISHPPTGVASDAPHWTQRVLVTEMWASLAIFAMWIAVAIATVWGPDFVSSDGAGTNSTTIPSGVAIALFATIGTWFVAKYGFGQRASRTDHP